MENSSEASYPRPERPPLARNAFGWIVLAILFAFMVSTALFKASGRVAADDPKLKAAEKTLEYSVSVASSAGSLGGGTLSPGQKKDVARNAESALARNLRDARTALGDAPGEAALVRATISREIGETPSAADLKGARAVPAELRPIAALVAEEKPSRAEIARLKDDPEGQRFSTRLASAQARERAGIPRDEARRGLVRPGYLARVAIFMAGLVGGAALALVLWVWYGLGRANGSFRPQGLPSLPMTAAESDRFALRAAGMFGGFLVGSVAIGLLRLGDAGSLALQVALLGGIALYSLRLPADPQVPHLSRIGFEVNRRELPQRIAWGVAAAFANIPILIAVTIVSSFLLKYAPTPTHPSTEALLHHPSLGTVLLTFFLASVCAPIWEETMFRGLLFQGLVGARFRPVLGALLSSFLFAAIHPQGFAMWPGLMAVALMSCALLAQTRSLVPSMVMHATHNGLTLAVTLIAGPVIGTVLPTFGLWGTAITSETMTKERTVNVDDSFESLVLAGLGATPKSLPTRFLYDAEGSALFEAITALPEYYPTRAETEILRAHAREIVADAGADEVVEFGSGSSEKTRLLLTELERYTRGRGGQYVPIDISAEFLAETAATLTPAFPGLTIAPLAGEYFTALAELAPTSSRRLILFLGSNIGNFESGGAAEFLRAIRGAMGARDTFLLGLDLVKAEADLVAAYDDAQGVTARFTCNLLVRANRELEADFDLGAFRHFARWNAEYERMEMGLLASRASAVHIAGREFAFAVGEEIHTEYSRKYTRASAERLTRETGFRIARWWTDGAGRFADALLEPVSGWEAAS